MRKLIVVADDDGDSREYLIPQGKHLHVQEGSYVRAGDRLTEGPMNPHDILRIKGIEEVQEYLVNEIQEVYRLQGVRIDDKHIEVIVRQMLQKVRIEDPGDTEFLEGEQVDTPDLLEENERMRERGPAAGHLPAAAARASPRRRCRPRASSRRPRSRRPPGSSPRRRSRARPTTSAASRRTSSSGT